MEEKGTIVTSTPSPGTAFTPFTQGGSESGAAPSRSLADREYIDRKKGSLSLKRIDTVLSIDADESGRYVALSKERSAYVNGRSFDEARRLLDSFTQAVNKVSFDDVKEAKTGLFGRMLSFGQKAKSQIDLLRDEYKSSEKLFEEHEAKLDAMMRQQKEDGQHLAQMAYRLGEIHKAQRSNLAALTEYIEESEKKRGRLEEQARSGEEEAMLSLRDFDAKMVMACEKRDALKASVGGMANDLLVLHAYRDGAEAMYGWLGTAKTENLAAVRGLYATVVLGEEQRSASETLNRSRTSVGEMRRRQAQLLGATLTSHAENAGKGSTDVQSITDARNVIANALVESRQKYKELYEQRQKDIAMMEESEKTVQQALLGRADKVSIGNRTTNAGNVQKDDF